MINGFVYIKTHALLGRKFYLLVTKYTKAEVSQIYCGPVPLESLATSITYFPLMVKAYDFLVQNYV
jgi:hypothetical protein